MAQFLERSVVVNGDAAIDWFVISGVTRGEESGSRRNISRLSSQPGGVYLLNDLIGATVNRFNQKNPAEPWQIYSLHTPEASFHPSDLRINHSFARCTRQAGKPTPAWRVVERLGIQKATADGIQPWQLIEDDPDEAALILLHDSNLGFRNHQELWPKALLNSDKKPWVILKMAKPIMEANPLWEYLRQNFSEQLIVVIAVDDLRQAEVQISRNLSWERTAQDVVWELTYNPKMNALLDCSHVIVTFPNVGAILISRSEHADQFPECHLFFDPKHSEGSWEQAFPGKMSGYQCCFLAGLSHHFLTGEPDINTGIQAGLSAMRTLHQTGFVVKNENELLPDLNFPLERILDNLEKQTCNFSRILIEFPTRLLHEKALEKDPPFAPGYWTILESCYTSNLDVVAREVVINGPETALKNVPLGQFNNLLTVDRREIESFQAIRALIKEYCAASRVERPVSIAVFGPPGSGKSFGVKQVAKSLKLPDVKIEDITFNLSQMKSPDELADAFHQIRDKVLKGIIPLVFWDEFDSQLSGQKLGWLRYFLAPMQDGEFTEGQLRHPIGRAIFVFAGGTCATIEEFEGKGTEEFKDAKGPDFVSRLRGYINILGANPPSKDSRPDPYYIIRRAILLRSILGMAAPQLFANGDGSGKLRMDRGLLEAMLKVRKYKHGARSMESILNMSTLANKTRFERSSLPSESQIELHVDAQNFFSILQRADFEEGRLEALARATHTVYCDGLRFRGEQTKAMVNYENLPEELKESNRKSAKDILRKLEFCGYEPVHARSNQIPLDFPGETLDRLAEEEHIRWMREKLQAERTPHWHYGPQRDDDQGIHPCLLPWREYSPEEKAQLFTVEEWQRIGEGFLPEDERNKDYDMVRGIPEILARAGYAVVKSRDDNKS